METRTPSGHPKRKIKRASRACDFCHRRGIRCKPPEALPNISVNTNCLTCVEHGEECTHLRQPQRRGTKPRTSSREKTSDNLGEGTTANPGTFCAFPSRDDLDMADESFKSYRNISSLVDIYLDTIYPLYPLFCETELLIGMSNRSIFTGQSYYLSLISMCALAAHYAKKGALFTSDSSRMSTSVLADEFLSEAVRIVPLSYDKGDINLLRSYGLLALVGAQNGDDDLLHRYLGLYHGLAAYIGIYSEERWPPSLSECEKEVWRRIFWAMYRFEVHNACVLGHVIRIPEFQTFVLYPCGVHHLPLLPGRNGMFENWFAGWNFTTDLYRILEHAIVDFRTKTSAQTTVLWSRNTPRVASIMDQLSIMQLSLMPQFAQAAMKSSDSGSNRCGFQVANILCTIHLVKMVALASEYATFWEACQTAQDLISSMSTVPVDYIRAFGTLLLQELSGVGYMLASVAGRQLTETELLRLRDVLLSMADFIETLGDHIDSAVNSAFRLRKSVARIDQAMSRAVQSITSDFE